MPEAWLAAALSATGSVLVARKRRIGWLVMMASNVCWVTFAFRFGVPPLALIDALYFGVNVYGWWRWR